MSDQVTYSADGAIATIAMDDGKANALSQGMFDDLNHAFDRAEAERATVVLTGRAGVFSAGFDLNAMRAGGPAAVEMMISGFRLSERLLAFPRPVVVAATGHAIAMGVFLCLSADYRVGAGGDFKVGANEVAIGLIMPRFGVEVCRQRLAPAFFHRAVITGEFFSPTDAVAAGFYDEVAAPSDVMSRALAAAARLAALPAEAFTATKLRTRDQAVRAVRAAIDADEEEFRSYLG